MPSRSSRPVHRTDRGPRPVNECGPVAALSRRARELAHLDRQLRQTLPDPLRHNVRLADVRDQRVVFLAPSSAWATRLRMCQGEILAAARRAGFQAASVIVRVAVLPREPEDAPASPRSLSGATAEHLRSSARSVSDPELRDLFLGLAALAGKTDSPHGS